MVDTRTTSSFIDTSSLNISQEDLKPVSMVGIKVPNSSHIRVEGSEVFVKSEDVRYRKYASQNYQGPHVNVFDVVDYILNKLGKMSVLKLQKLVYYSQAWSLVWDEKQLFDEEIQAWANGPIIKDLLFFIEVFMK